MNNMTILEKTADGEKFTWKLRTKEGDGYMSLILEELEEEGGFVDVFHVAKSVAEKLHVKADQPFRNQIRYRLNRLCYQGKVEVRTKKGERGYFPTNYYKLKG